MTLQELPFATADQAARHLHELIPAAVERMRAALGTADDLDGVYYAANMLPSRERERFLTLVRGVRPVPEPAREPDPDLARLHGTLTADEVLADLPRLLSAATIVARRDIEAAPRPLRMTALELATGELLRLVPTAERARLAERLCRTPNHEARALAVAEHTARRHVARALEAVTEAQGAPDERQRAAALGRAVTALRSLGALYAGSAAGGEDVAARTREEIAAVDFAGCDNEAEGRRRLQEG
jgi:hypothetical protein